MKRTMLSLLILSGLATSVQAEPRTLQLDDGMPLVVTPTVDISSATNQAGQPVTFTLMHDFKVDGVVLIPKGAAVYGKIEKAHHSKMLGKKGKLEVDFLDAKAIDGSVVLVRESVERQGNVAPTTTDKVAGMLPYGIGMLRNGKDAILPAGMPLTIFIDGTSKFSIVPGQKPKQLNPPTALPGHSR